MKTVPNKFILQFNVLFLNFFLIANFLQGSYKLLEVLEFGFLKFKSWKTLENSHISEKVLEKYLNV